MPLVTKTYEQFLSDTIVALATALKKDPNTDFPNGNGLKAIFQAASLGGNLFLQSQAQKNYAFARATTAEGEDLDSWVAQFGPEFARLPARYAQGIVRFGVNTVQPSVIEIRPGAVVQTIGGKIQYAVIADTTKAGWSPSRNAYLLQAGALFVDCECRAQVVGSGSNIQAGNLIQLATSVPGINTVTNNAAILNGDEQETDEKLRERFRLGFNSINANGTIASFLFAGSSVQTGLDITVVENSDQNGNPRVAYVLVVVDDGSGSPPSDLLEYVHLAIDVIRAAGIEIAVFGCIKTNVVLSMNLRIASGYIQQAVTLAATNALIEYINSLKIGQRLYASQIQKTVMNVPGVESIQPGSFVCAQADTNPTNRTVFRTDNTKITLGTY